MPEVEGVVDTYENEDYLDEEEMENEVYSSSRSSHKQIFQFFA